MLPVIVITPINEVSEAFKNTIVTVFANMKNEDLWIISVDNCGLELKEEIGLRLLNEGARSKNYAVLNSDYQKGAGNARNYALDYIIKQKIETPFILTFIDSDDNYSTGFFNLLKKYFISNQGIITYSYFLKNSNKTMEIRHDDDVVDYNNFLKNYCSSCLTTALLITDRELLRKFRFGHRKRANDQLFFLSAVKSFGEIRLCSKIVAAYNISRKPSLSNRKYKMPIYKFMVLLDHGFSFHKACYYFWFYIINKIFK